MDAYGPEQRVYHFTDISIPVPSFYIPTTDYLGFITVSFSLVLQPNVDASDVEMSIRPDTDNYTNTYDPKLYCSTPLPSSHPQLGEGEPSNEELGNEKCQHRRLDASMAPSMPQIIDAMSSAMYSFDSITIYEHYSTCSYAIRQGQEVHQEHELGHEHHHHEEQHKQQQQEQQQHTHPNAILPPPPPPCSCYLQRLLRLIRSAVFLTTVNLSNPFMCSISIVDMKGVFSLGVSQPNKPVCLLSNPSIVLPDIPDTFCHASLPPALFFITVPKSIQDAYKKDGSETDKQQVFSPLLSISGAVENHSQRELDCIEICRGYIECNQWGYVLIGYENNIVSRPANHQNATDAHSTHYNELFHTMSRYQDLLCDLFPSSSLHSDTHKSDSVISDGMTPNAHLCGQIESVEHGNDDDKSNSNNSGAYGTHCPPSAIISLRNGEHFQSYPPLSHVNKIYPKPSLDPLNTKQCKGGADKDHTHHGQGLYLLCISPYHRIPPHYHLQMHEIELNLGLSVSDYCLAADHLHPTRTRSSYGALNEWNTPSTTFAHYYNNHTPYWHPVLCVDSPAFIPNDEILLPISSSEASDPQRRMHTGCCGRDCLSFNTPPPVSDSSALSSSQDDGHCSDDGNRNGHFNGVLLDNTTTSISSMVPLCSLRPLSHCFLGQNGQVSRMYGTFHPSFMQTDQTWVQTCSMPHHISSINHPVKSSSNEPSPCLVFPGAYANQRVSLSFTPYNHDLALYPPHSSWSDTQLGQPKLTCISSSSSLYQYRLPNAVLAFLIVVGKTFDDPVFLNASGYFSGNTAQTAGYPFHQQNLPPMVVKHSETESDTSSIQETEARLLFVRHKTRGWELPGGKADHIPSKYAEDVQYAPALEAHVAKSLETAAFLTHYAVLSELAEEAGLDLLHSDYSHDSHDGKSHGYLDDDTINPTASCKSSIYPHIYPIGSYRIATDQQRLDSSYSRTNTPASTGSQAGSPLDAILPPEHHKAVYAVIVPYSALERTQSLQKETAEAMTMPLLHLPPHPEVLEYAWPWLHQQPLRASSLQGNTVVAAVPHTLASSTPHMSVLLRDQVFTSCLRFIQSMPWV